MQFTTKIGRPIFTRFLQNAPEWSAWETLAGLFRTPDFVVSADVEHAEHVEHAVEVALIADRNGGAPELLNEGFFGRAGGGGEAADGGRGQHSDGVTGGKRLAIQGVTVGKHAYPLTNEELLNTVGEDDLAGIFVPPVIVGRPIAYGTPGVVAEGRGLAVATQDGGHVEVGAIRGKAGLRAGDFD